MFSRVSRLSFCRTIPRANSRTYINNSSHKVWSVENKGTSFTQAERNVLGLRGLLPPIVETLEQQAARAIQQFNSIEDPLVKYNYLNRIKNCSETLFYHLLVTNLEAMCPIIYTPTVGKACQKYGQIFRTAEGMYFTKEDRGHFREMLDNWAHDVSIIVVTDGSRILGLGDLGASGMGIPIGKLALYVACGGFRPHSTLPVMMDTGTNNQSLLEDPFYLGLRHKRLVNQEYYAMWEEFLMAVKDKWPNALVQFEDISNDHCFELLKKYRNRLKCFNDDIQGTGAVVAAGFLGASKIADSVPLSEHKIVFLGAGSAAVGVANQICTLIAEVSGVSVDEIRSRFYLIDSRGLVTTTRGDTLESHKIPYARTDMKQEIKTLQDAINILKPTALIGLSGLGGAFTKEIIESMANVAKRPIIFALSNPTSSAECTAEDAYKYTDGRAVYASGSPFGPVTLPDGRRFVPGQGNNMYIFPGLGLGATLAKSKVSDAMVTVAAAKLASLVQPEDLAQGRVYPALSNIREISSQIATAVMEKSFEEDLAMIDRPEGNLYDYVRRQMYTPHYDSYTGCV